MTCLSMKLFFLSLCMVAVVIPAWTQSADEEIVAFFNEKWEQVYDSSAAISFYRTVVPKETGYIVRDYYVSGVKQMEAECSQYKPKLVMDGKVSYYYDNGVLKKEGTYEQNHERGVFSSFYQTGAKKEEMEYSKALMILLS